MIKPEQTFPGNDTSLKYGLIDDCSVKARFVRKSKRGEGKKGPTLTLQLFFLSAQAGGRTWDLFVFRLFSLNKAAP